MSGVYIPFHCDTCWNSVFIRTGLWLNHYTAIHRNHFDGHHVLYTPIYSHICDALCLQSQVLDWSHTVMSLGSSVLTTVWGMYSFQLWHVLGLFKRLRWRAISSGDVMVKHCSVRYGAGLLWKGHILKPCLKELDEWLISVNHCVVQDSYVESLFTE